MKNKNLLLNVLVLAASTALLLNLFTSCDSLIKTKGDPSSRAPKGNGDFYAGKTSIYTYTDPAAPCAQVGASGQPFANRQIQYNAATLAAYLVRDNCADLEPVLLPPADYVVDPIAQTISYQGQSFALQNDFTDEDIVPLACPAGLTPNGLRPANLFASSLNLTGGPWSINPGITSSLFGSISALPRFQIFRNDPALLDFYRRISQYPTLPGATQYAISFLVSQGNTDSATIFYWEANGREAVGHLDFATLQTQITYQPGFNPGEVSISATPYGNGYMLTMFLLKTSASSAPEIGISATNYDPLRNPEPGNVGDFLNATAGHLHRVSDYCN